MLEATADANNRNAFDLSLEGYKKSVGSVAGMCSYFDIRWLFLCFINSCVRTKLCIYQRN